MSEISVLSNQYEKLVATSDKINNSVITFKKKSLLNNQLKNQKYPKLNLTREELSNAQQILTLFLENILKIIQEDAKDSDFIPALIFDDYKNQLTKNQFIKEDIDQLVKKIKGDQQIDVQDISVLDEILSILDTERSTLFRKLRTARG